MAGPASKQTNATAEILGAPGRLLGVHWVGAALAGTVVLKDGGASGTSMLTINTPASATESGFFPIEGGGMHFLTDIHATLTNVGFITAIYQAD